MLQHYEQALMARTRHSVIMTIYVTCVCGSVRQSLCHCVCVCVCVVAVDAAMDSAAGAFNRFDMEDREQREEQMRKGRFRLGVLTLFRGLQEKTTSHGLPHVHHARGSLLHSCFITS